MINSYKDILKAIDPRHPRFKLNASNGQSAREIVCHLADALRSGQCPERLYLDLTQEKDRNAISTHMRFQGLGSMSGYYPSNTWPRLVVELHYEDIHLIAESLKSGPRTVFLDLYMNNYESRIVEEFYKLINSNTCPSQLTLTLDGENISRSTIRDISNILVQQRLPKGLKLKFSREFHQLIPKLRMAIDKTDPEGSLNAFIAMHNMFPCWDNTTEEANGFIYHFLERNPSFDELSNLLNSFDNYKCEEILNVFQEEFIDWIEHMLRSEETTSDSGYHTLCRNLILIMEEFWPGKLKICPNEYWNQIQSRLAHCMKDGTQEQVDCLWNEFVCKNALLGSPISHSYLWRSLLSGFVDVYQKVNPESQHLKEALKAQVKNILEVPTQRHPLEESDSARFRLK